MARYVIGILFACVALALVSTPEALAQKKKVEIGKKWSGSVDDEKAIKPEAIVSDKGLDAVWKAWKVKGDMPKVDFTKDMVVAVYSVGSGLNIAGANLNDKGDLQVIGFGTRDIRPGFRYVLGVVSKDGVKTVNGKALPKE
jgi:hypothetical protein